VPRFRTIKNSFLGGQISRTSVGRTDLPSYPHSCEILQNMVPQLSGGAYRRPGTLATDSFAGTTPPRLIPFIVSRSEAYTAALFPGGVVKIYRANGNGPGQRIVYTATGTTPYQANLGVINNLGNVDDDVWAVQYTQSNDVMFLTHPNYAPQAIKRHLSPLGAVSFTVGQFDADLAAAFFAIPIGDGTDRQIAGLKWAQSYPYLNQNATTTTMSISAPTSPGTTRTITCSTPYFNNLQIGAIIAINQPDGASNGIAFMQITGTAGTISVLSTTATALAMTNVFDTNAHTDWWESAWSNYRGWPRTTCIFQQRLAMGGTVPISGENVDVLGIPVGAPDSIWFTETGDYNPKFTALGDSAIAGTTGTLANGKNYTTPGNYVYYPVDDSQGDGKSTGPLGIQPFRVTLADSQLDTIQWMSPDQQILLGTLNEEWIIAPVNGAFDVANSLATVQSHYGSDFIQANRIGYELIFTQKSQYEVRAYQYNYFDQSFFGEPVQLFFDEYPTAEFGTMTNGRRKFRQMEWDVTRSTLWCVDTAGNFFGMTRDRKLQVTMWHTHQLGGFNPALVTGPGGPAYGDPAWAMCDGSVISMTSTPNPVSGINDIWLVVKRTIAGVANWQIERMIGSYTVRNSAYQAIYPGQGTEPYLVDSALIFMAPDVTANQVTVGANYNGQTLTGTYYSPIYGLFQIMLTGPVSGGLATINPANLPPDYPAGGFLATLGLAYTPIIKTVRVDSQGQIGTTMGAIKRISKVYLWLYKTLGLTCGSPPGQTTMSPAQVQFQASATPGQSPEIYTGEKHVFFPAQYDRNGWVYITQTQPFPLLISALITEGEEYEQ
jgi:hypothetical protein